MAKLSDAMIKGLRSVANGTDQVVPDRTIKALEARFMVTGSRESGYRITPTGAYALEKIKNQEAEAAREAERLSRPVPAAAFVEPSAKRPPVLDFEYEDEESVDWDAVEVAETELPGMWERADFTGGQDEVRGPAVRLTPAPAGTKAEATDAEVLQLLAMLDHGAKVVRPPYRAFSVSAGGAGESIAFAAWIDPARLDAAAREAVRAGLAREAFVSGRFVLSAEPVHLLAADPHTACGRYAGPNAIRLRVTTDRAKVTHDRCK